jgi:hypothetical protein
MALLLENKKSIISVLAVRLELYKYRNNEGDTPHTEIVRMCDAAFPVKVKIGDVFEDFEELGNILSITSVKNELAPSQSQVSISMSMLNKETTWKFLNNPIKNSKVAIYRVMYDSVTKTIINTSTVGKFNGTINYYTVEDSPGRPGTSTITFVCNNKTVDLTRVKGRNNGPVAMKFYYPNDTSFDRILNLTGTRYNFGSPIVKMEPKK